MDYGNMDGMSMSAHSVLRTPVGSLLFFIKNFRYSVRRLIRGVSSSRECARQAKKRYLQEPAVSVILDVVEKLPTEALLSHAFEATGNKNSYSRVGCYV